MLNELYGENDWLVNIKKNPSNPLIHSKVNRTERELPFMYRFYEFNGEINVEKSLSKINEYYLPLTGKNLTKIPPHDTDFL